MTPEKSVDYLKKRRTDPATRAKWLLGMNKARKAAPVTLAPVSICPEQLQSVSSGVKQSPL